MKKLVPLLLLSVCVGAGGRIVFASYGAGEGDAMRAALPAPAIARDAPAVTVPPESPLSGEFEVASVAHNNGRAFVNLKARLDHKLAPAAPGRYAFELIDSRGNPVVKPTPADVPEAAKGKSELAYRTPALDDGYYIARVTAVVADNGERGVFSKDIYLGVSGGEVTPMEHEEFVEQAGTNIGVFVDGGKGVER